MDIDKTMIELINDILFKKKTVFSECLESIGVRIDLDLEAKKAFPDIKIVKHENGSETWMYNNGTLGGLKVVTFHNGANSIYKIPEQYNFSYDISYEIHIIDNDKSHEKEGVIYLFPRLNYYKYVEELMKRRPKSIGILANDLISDKVWFADLGTETTNIIVNECPKDFKYLKWAKFKRVRVDKKEVPFIFTTCYEPSSQESSYFEIIDMRD